MEEVDLGSNGAESAGLLHLHICAREACGLRGPYALLAGLVPELRLASNLEFNLANRDGTQGSRGGM